MLSEKCRVCRRAGVKLFLKGDRCLSEKCSIEKRNFPPGSKANARSFKKQSNYGKQLTEKQKMKFEYGLNERQMVNLFKTASSSKEATGTKMLGLIESRIDNILYRSGVFTSRNTSRQYIVHTGIQINKKKVSSPAYLVKPGDSIGLPKMDKEKKLAETSWYKFANNEIKIERIPSKEEIGSAIDEQLIVEYYSR